MDTHSKDKKHDRRPHRMSDSESSRSSKSDDSSSEKAQERSRRTSRERSSAQRVTKKSNHRIRAPSRSPPPPRKKDCPGKGETVVEKISPKEAHRHRNYRRKSRERAQEKSGKLSRDRSRSKDRPSSSASKRRDRSTSADRKQSSDRIKRERSDERLDKLSKNRRRDRDGNSSKRKDRRSRSRDRPVGRRNSPVHQRGGEKEEQQQPTPKQKFSEDTATFSNSIKSKDEGKKPKNSLDHQNPPKMSFTSVQTKLTTNLNPPSITIPAAAAGLSSITNPPPPAIELPSYYNPATINVAKYTNQIQKRKLLWSNKKAESVDQNVAKWQQTAQFAKDEDGKVASKFMRLMGIKNATPTGKVVEGGEQTEGMKPADFAKMKADMELQYEVARQTTHTMRGMGLGFSRQF